MQVKRLFWIGSSDEDLKEFPKTVQRAMGYALYIAQQGEKHEHTKPLQGFGSAKVLEIRENDRSGTFRAVYTIEIKNCIFVLHAFQKKSKSGIATTRQDIDLIKRRLKEAWVISKELEAKETNEKKNKV